MVQHSGARPLNKSDTIILFAVEMNTNSVTPVEPYCRSASPRTLERDGADGDWIWFCTRWEVKSVVPACVSCSNSSGGPLSATQTWHIVITEVGDGKEKSLYREEILSQNGQRKSEADFWDLVYTKMDI